MARQELNQLPEMVMFTRVVESASLSAAARHFRMTPSAVSKSMSRLEARLGVRLLNRSTRKLQPTPEGLDFYTQCVRILADIAAAEREAARGATPQGRIRVSANVPFGVHCLLPLLPEFLVLYPDVVVDIVLTDVVVDLLQDRTDVAIRTGPLKPSNLMARKLGESRLVVVAAPSYLKRWGEPRTPDALAKHNRLGFGFARHTEAWPFLGETSETVLVKPEGNALVSDGESMRLLALAGLGIARLANFHVGPDIAAGRLVPVLEAYNPGDKQAIYAVFVGPGRQLPARVRLLLDFLVKRLQVG